MKVFRFYNWSMITFSRWSQVQMKLVSLSVKFFASEQWTHTWTSTASVWWGSCGVEAGEVSYITLLWLFGKIQQRERTCEHADCKQLHQPSVFAANTASEDTAAASICSCWSLRLLQMPHTCDYFAKCSSWTRGRSLVQLHFIKGSDSKVKFKKYKCIKSTRIRKIQDMKLEKNKLVKLRYLRMR